MKVSNVVGAALLTAGLLAGCSSGASAGHGGLPGVKLPTGLPTGLPTNLPTNLPTDLPTGSGGGSLPTSGGGAPAATGALSQATMRFGNFYAPGNKAGPAIDIYDAPQHQAATPIVTNLAYGSVSAYVHPHLVPNSTNIVELFALPAGEDPVANAADDQGVGGLQDDGSHPQVTVLLSADSNTPRQTPLQGLSFSERVEKGTDNGSKSAIVPAPASGKGEVLVDTSAVFNLHNNGLYLMVDKSCDPPLNGDPQIPGLPLITNDVTPTINSPFAFFAEAPGTHQLALVAWSPSQAPTCAQLTARQGQTSADLAAGQQIEAYVYGTSLTDLHLALAPVQP